ncbi:MAG: transcription elongation factor GreA, partial [Pseudomonadota bacterium]
MDKIPMTPAGYQKLEAELKQRVAEERPNIIAAI